MMRSWKTRGLTVLVAAMLQACGGGGGKEPPPSGTPSSQEDPAPIVAQQASITVIDADTGASLPGVTVSLNKLSAQTDANGQGRINTVPGDGLVLKAALTGYADAIVRVDLKSGIAFSRTLALTRTAVAAAHTTSASIDTGFVATIPGTPALVTLSAKSLVDSASGSVVTGNVTARIRAIDPASQSSAMPGSYLYTSNTGPRPLESFGALQVDLSDAQGKRLQLATGKTATIRIPVKTRALTLPDTIPLYYLDETTGLWKQEGQAALRRDAVIGDYYEGEVSHFSYWNADMPLETISVTGCVRDDKDALPPLATVVSSDGTDYSGRSSVYVDAKGEFTVQMKRDGRAAIVATEGQAISAPQGVGPSATDIRLTECLVIKAPPGLPEVVEQPPANLSAVENGSLLLTVLARGAEPMRFQWLRNGEPLLNQTTPRLWISRIGVLDNGARYQLKITSAKGGEITTAGTTLTVASTAEMQLIQLYNLSSVVSALPSAMSLVLAPSTTVDMELGQMFAPADVCASGRLDVLQLDGVNVRGGEAVRPSAQHTLVTTFAQCDAEGELLNGRASASFKYTVLDGGLGFNLSSATTLAGLVVRARSDDDVGLQGDGVFDTLNVVRDSGAQVSITATPRPGAQLRRPGTDRVITYVSGNMAVSAVADSGNVENVTFTYNALTFTLAGKTYVLNGKTGDLGGATPTGQVTVSVNGKQVGIWSGGLGSTVTGVIDPF